MKLASKTLEVELDSEEISGGEILISDNEIELKLKNQQIEPLITITFGSVEELTELFNWLNKHTPIRRKDDMTRESVSNGIEELETF